MKRTFALILAIVILAASGIVIRAAELQPVAFTFVGRWQPSDDPVLIDDNGLQDIQNLRKSGKHFKGVGGHTTINASTLSTYPYIVNGFHFRKDRPQESHVIVVASADTSNSSSVLYQNTTAIPSTGDFSATVLHTDVAGGYGNGRFSLAPNGNMIYTTGPETLIWGGNEIHPMAFVSGTTVMTGTTTIITNPTEYTDQVTNTRRTADQVALVGGGIDDYTKLMLHFNGTDGSTTFTDSETTAKTVTAAGSAEIDTGQYKYSTGSLLIDGVSTSYATTADHADWNMADGTFTIDFWVRFNALPTTGQSMVLFSQRSARQTKSELSVRNSAGAYSLAFLLKSAGVGVHALSAAWTPAVNTWYHIAVVRGWGGVSNAWAFTVDGTSLDSVTQTYTYPDIAGALIIGAGSTELVEEAASTAAATTYDIDTVMYATNAIAANRTLTGDATNYVLGTYLPGFAWTSNYSYTPPSTYVRNPTNQRFHIDLGIAKAVTGIYYENYHSSGSGTDVGVNNFTFWGSNSSTAYAELTYSADTGWTQITTSASTMAEHSASDAVDPQYLTASNSTAYRYYAFKFADNHGNGDMMGVRRIELQAHTNVAFNGWIDEFRVSKGIARWTSNFTPHEIAYRGQANHWIVGFPRPVQGVKFYVADANTQTSTLTAQEWNGSSWTDMAITDGTASGGVTLAQTGSVTFSSTVNTAKQRYIHGYSLYWYQFNISAGQASIYYVTGDAPMQEIRNIWSGRQVYATKAMKYQTDYKDYTDSVNDDIDTTTMDLSSMPNTGYVLLGFTTPVQAVDITMEPESENSTASNTLTVSFWDGQNWTATAAKNDGTATSDKGLNKSGVVAWNYPGAGVEFPTAIGDETPLYYYKFAWAGTLDSDTKIGEIRGMEATNALPTHEVAVMYQNRLFLMNEYNGLKNKLIYSMDAAPDVFNGSDTGVFYIGDDTDITAAVTVYNVFSNTAYEQMIIGKKGEIYRLAGDGPEYWTVKRISENVGCVAPLSMVSVEITGEEKGQRRQVAIFQGDSGFYMTDGATVIPISEDIKCYFDPNDSRYIPTTRRTKTVAWYDPKIRAYKAVISSGSTATYHNVELEYSLDTREWTKIYRENGSGADPLQSGWRVWDTDGLSYTYGGNKAGQIYRLENGNTWAGTGITQYLHTKDMILDNVAPFFRKSTVKHMRTALKKKTNGGTVSIAHYGDQVLTVNATSNQVVPSAITVSTAPYNTQSCNLGPFLYHSFKLTASAATVSDGMELTGLGFWVEPYTAVR